MGLKRQLQKGDRILVGDEVVMTIEDCYSRVRVDVVAPKDQTITVEEAGLEKGQKMTIEQQQREAIERFVKREGKRK
jgi:hypothetical protein